jgi:hypothetical protein
MAAQPRALAALLLAVALLIGGVVPALAWEGRVEGVPSAVGDTTAYLIGHDAGGWHLATHGPRQQHHFTGVLTTDGSFTDVQLRRPEQSDSVRLADGGHALRLNFVTYDYTDGLDFRVADGTRVTFRLEVDEHLVAPSHVYLGARGQHPEHDPFTIWR